MLDTCIIGSDGEDGVSIRWPNKWIFCDVTDGIYYISTIPDDVNTPQDIKFIKYDSTQLSEVCNLVNILLSQ